MQPTTIETLAAWAARLRFSDLPERVIEKARAQQASVLAASLAGRQDSGARKVLAATQRAAEAGRVPVLAGGFSTSRPRAVFANAAVSCTFDFDEILLLGHPGHSSVTVPLALGTELARTWGEATAAQVAANEVAGRLGLATFFGPQNGQMIPHLHCAGAAVAAGRLLGLDERALAHALAIALAQPPAPLWPSFLGPIESKILTAAQGALTGVQAAELAAAGLTGALDLLDHPHGFFRRFTWAPVPRALGGLGRAWLSDTLQVKLHAACWYFQGALDAVLAARAELAQGGGGFRPEEVARIECRVTFLAEAVTALEGGTSHGRLTANEANFSLPVALALALVNGRLLPQDLAPEPLAAQEPAVRALADKIRVQHDWELTGKLLGELDRALDLPGLLGTVSLLDLFGALRSARREFPRAGALRLAELGRAVLRAPAVLARLGRGRGRRYDLGEHDLSSLLLPISGEVEVELAGGRRARVRRDVPEGALGLPGASARALAKLHAAAGPVLGDEAAAHLVRALATAAPSQPLAEAVPLVTWNRVPVV